MTAPGLQLTLESLLAEMNLAGGYPASLVCTDDGLLVASAGETLADEEIAGFTALFDDVVHRAHRDLDLCDIDEVALRDAKRGRLVIRPVYVESRRFFLVVRVPSRCTWRRYTNRVCAQLPALLAPLFSRGS